MNSFTDSLTGPVLWLWTTFVVLGFIGAIAFPVLYHFGSRGEWRHTDLGRHLMAFSVAVGAALLALLLRIVLGDYTGRAVVNFGSIFGLVAVVWWRSVQYVRVWRKPEKPRGEGVVNRELV